MKKFLSIICVMTLLVTSSLGFASYSDDFEFTQSLQRMGDKGMTRYDSVDEYRPGDFVTREQAAKFFDVYMANHGGKVAQLTELFGCDFGDKNLMDSTLIDHIESVCNLGIMKGNQRFFRPTDTLTKAEAITVLIRMTSGILPETEISPRWKSYHTQAYENGLTKEKDVWALDKPVTRYEMALLLSRVAGNTFTNPADQEIEDIEKILSELFGLHTN